jgi:hypothetical protein
MNSLVLKNIGPIASAEIEFGDLTLFVGPQASGKSILLQMVKLLEDKNNIQTLLKKNNFDWGKDVDKFLELFFGESMSTIFTSKSFIKYDNKTYTVKSFLPKQGTREVSKSEKLFYVPAQRVVTMTQGWPRSFGSFDIGDPFVIKQFSESVRVLMEREAMGNGKSDNLVFPKTNRIKEPLRKIIDDNIFHGAKITSDVNLKKRFLLNVGESRLPFMAWSAGQKEFMPLLLSLYYLMPASKIKTRDGVKYIIIEEPEMGLHPNAIQALLIVFIELISRGYKLIVSTHSPVLLEMMWCINYIKNYNGNSAFLFELFSIQKTKSLQEAFDILIDSKSLKTYFFDNNQSNNVIVKDISILDAGSEDNNIANWGGLTDFSSKAAEIVAKIVANAQG